MHTHSADRWRHDHVFLGARHEQNERKTWFVIGLTTLMMVAEIIGGAVLGSMALTADGWHMMTHAGALAISAFAYTYARRHKKDRRFVFGTGKLGDLAGFTSALILSVIALFIAGQAIERLIAPVSIRFGEALSIAALGFIVNIVSAVMLHDGDAHHHEHDGHMHHHHDHNLRSAYLHVLADAATSVFAMTGLLLGWIYGWVWVDAVVGLVGSCVIASWSYSLIRASGRVLLDIMPDQKLADAIRGVLETDGDEITDLHLWQIGTGHYGAIISLVTDHPQVPDLYKASLSRFKMLSHVTVEIHPCSDV